MNHDKYLWKRGLLNGALCWVFVLSITLVVCLAGCGNGSTDTAAPTDAAASADDAAAKDAATTTEDATQEAEPAAADEPAKFDNDNIDYAVVFPSWNADSQSLAALIELVKATVDESADTYVAPEDRIATFDMDGTIICEKAPFYADWCLLLHRVLDNPDYNGDYVPSDETVAICKELRATLNAGESPSEEQEKDKARLIASEFAGMTTDEFHEYARQFAQNVDAVGFEGMTYSESFYKPMLEVINYLKANDFDVWMISACEREFVRALVPLALDIPFDHIVGTDVSYASTNEGDEAYDKYTMDQDEDIVLSDDLGQETAKTGKPIAIMREIGKRPILSFGNSSGDYAMLNYAQSNPDHTGMGVLVLCDDAEREYGDLERAADQLEEAQKQGWNVFHMTDVDWATIYGDNVTKTELPGAVEEVELAEAA